MEKQKLTHAVVWPNGQKANVELVDPDGEVQAKVPIKFPVRGSDLARMMPDQYTLETEACTVVSLSGKVLVASEMQFDTAVVTERREITMEEKIEIIARRAVQDDRKKREEQRRKRKEQREAQEQENGDEPAGAGAGAGPGAGAGAGHEAQAELQHTPAPEAENAE